MHEIKKNVPAPDRKAHKRGRDAVYPMATMVDGDCFDADIKDGEAPKAAVQRMRAVTSSFRLRHKSSMAFTVRAVTEKGKTFVRVWARQSVPPVSRTAMDFFAEQ